MAFNTGYAGILRYQVSPFNSGGSRAGIALDSAYVHRTSGDGAALRIAAPAAEPLNEVLFFLDLSSGNRALITVGVRVYNADTTLSTIPGTTLLATASTVTYPAADDRWIRCEFATPYTPTVGELLWVPIFNTSAAPATDFPTVMSATNATFINNVYQAAGYTTTNGFATAGTFTGELPFMARFGSTWYGQSCTQLNGVPFTNNALKRGIIISPRRNVRISAIETGLQSANIATVEIYESTQVPSDTPIYSYSLSAAEAICGVKVFNPQPFLRAGRTYYIVYDPTFNFFTPACGQVEDYASFASAFDSLVDGVSLCGGVQETVSNTWDVRYDLYPQTYLTVGEFLGQPTGYAA